MSPQWPNLILPAHIPNVKLDVLVCYGLHVEANSRNGGDILVEFQLVEDG
jgi:hypothetical protein